MTQKCSPTMPSAERDIGRLLRYIERYIDELDNMESVCSLRPECPPPVSIDKAREDIIQLQGDLIIQHLIDPMQDEAEAASQLRLINNLQLDRLRKHVHLLANTENEQLDRQRWLAQAGVTLQESKVEMRPRPPVSTPHSNALSSLPSLARQSLSPSMTDAEVGSVAGKTVRDFPDGRRLYLNTPNAEPERMQSGGGPLQRRERTERKCQHQDQHQLQDQHQHQLEGRFSEREKSKPAALPSGPGKRSTELIVIGWIQDPSTPESPRASLLDVASFLMPAMLPDADFDESHPLSPLSWGGVAGVSAW